MNEDKLPKSEEFAMADNEGVASLTKHVEENTPLDGNKCKSEGCDGEVIKKVSGMWPLQGRFTYSLPECNKCGRQYLHATNVCSTGEEEFREMLHTPFILRRECEKEPPIIARLRKEPFTI